MKCVRRVYKVEFVRRVCKWSLYVECVTRVLEKLTGIGLYSSCTLRVPCFIPVTKDSKTGPNTRFIKCNIVVRHRPINSLQLLYS